MPGFDDQNCILCRQAAKRSSELFQNATFFRYQCPRCGMFLLTARAETALNATPLRGKAPFVSLSALTCHQTIRCLRHGTPIACLTDMQRDPNDGCEYGLGLIDLQQALALFPKTVGDRLDQTLINFGLLSDFPGFAFQLNENKYPVTYSENRQALLYILDQLKEDDCLTYRRGASNQEGSVYNIQLTVKGWNRIAALEQGSATDYGRQAVVAMWVHSGMASIYEHGLKRGIESAGYEVMRMDRGEQPNKINDPIIAAIRKSRFMVADFTGQRTSVYYEAGLAAGLGIPVIWTCRKDEIDTMQFDACQYNTIAWVDANDLAQRLCHRIEATIGHGGSG